MKLFQQLLSTLFPNSLQTNPKNPIGMFVWLISPQQFFSVVYRRIIEPYKIHLYDITLDHLDGMWWLQNTSTAVQSDIERQFSYVSVAQFNGRKNFSPTNTSTIATLISFYLLDSSLRWFDKKLITSFYITVHLFTYVMLARMKVFPQHYSPKRQYSRFIKTFFAFYELLLKKRWLQVTQKEKAALQSTVLKKIHLFFFLYAYYKRINEMYFHDSMLDWKFYNWYYADQLVSKQLYPDTQQYITEAVDGAVYKSSFSSLEEKIMDHLFPQELQIKYFLLEDYMHEIADILLEQIFGEYSIEEKLLPFLQSDKHIELFFTELLERWFFKENYFIWVKKLTNHLFHLNASYEVSKEIDDFITSIDMQWSMEWIKMPDNLVKEGKIVDTLMNFYLTFISWFSLWRWENFAMRFLKHDFLDIFYMKRLEEEAHDEWYIPGSEKYINSYQYIIPYYRWMYRLLKSWKIKKTIKIKRHLPKASVPHIFYIKTMSFNSDIALLFQDINKRATRLEIQEVSLITQFKHLCAQRLSEYVSQDDLSFFQSVYKDVLSVCRLKKDQYEAACNTMHKQDIRNLKENIYAADFWVWHDMVERLTPKFSVQSMADHLKFIAYMRETLFGFMLYLVYRDEFYKNNVTYEISMIKVYCSHVLLLDRHDTVKNVEHFYGLFKQLYETYKPLLYLYCTIDDNQDYLMTITSEMQNIEKHIQKESNVPIEQSADYLALYFRDPPKSIWLRNVYKTITYYNKRYLFPQS